MSCCVNMRLMKYSFSLLIVAFAFEVSAIVVEVQSTSESPPTGNYDSLSWTGVLGGEDSNGSIVASGVAVDEHWVLTAKHIANSIKQLDDSNGNTFNVVSREEYGSADLALLEVTERLNTDYGLTIYSLYSGTTVGNDVAMIGYGYAGAVHSSGNSYTWETSTARQRRWGSNTVDSDVDSILDLGFNTADTTYEAGAADKDSGGGVFMQDAQNNWKLAGTMVGVEGGATGYTNTTAVDVQDYSDWISTTVPEPTIAMLFGVSGLAFWLRKRFLGLF